jgi:hypothetical protein
MASFIVAGITVVPLVLLVWDLGKTKRESHDRFAGQARSPVA